MRENWYWLLKLYGNLKPYFLKNQGKTEGTYVRIGATNRQADLDSIHELERQKRHISFDEEICYETTFENLDTSALFDRFEKIGRPLNPEKLQNLKLVKSDNNILYPTNALMILLGEFPHCMVKCARFKGTTMDVFIDKKEYTGDLFSVLENTQHFILNHINLGAKINGLYREEAYEIPEVAIREALVNAVIHRDYVNRGRDIKVGVYDDVVNIVSPGSLPNNITMEDIFNGRSESRNRVIANIFKELGLIEQWGSGIGRIINSCKEYGLPIPQIEEQNDFVDIEIVRSQKISQTEKGENGSIMNDYERLRTIANDYERLIPEKQNILLYLLDHQSISRKEATSLIKAKNTKTYQILNELLEVDQLIEKKGQGRATYYTLK